MAKRQELTVERVAECFATCVVFMANHFYCTGAASEDELRAAAVDWTEDWLKSMRAKIAPGTVCPSRR